jgi:putative SOS response-associated peptidase YedK
MCGRYTFAGPMDDVADHFQLADPPKLTPRYNVAPGQAVAVVALKQDGERFGLAMLKWGLVPEWADNPDRGVRPVNARDDSLGKPMFARLFAAQRCLLPATGFYEWRLVGKRKEPVHFSLTGGGLMAFAGLWSVWKDGTRKVPTVCLVTTTPNELVRDYHDRMPVIVPPDSYRKWLDNDTPHRELKAMLKPFPAEGMTARLANPVVNRATSEGPECLSDVGKVPSTSGAGRTEAR